MATGILEKVRQTFDRQHKSAADDFQSLTRDLASGKQLDPQDIARVRAAADKTEDELSAEVAQLIKEVEDFKRLLPAARQVDEREQAFSAAHSTLETRCRALMAAARERECELRQEVVALHDNLTASRTAVNHLWSFAPEETKMRYDQLRDEGQAALAKTLQADWINDQRKR